MSTWSEFPSKALWTASIITQMPSMPRTASLVNRPSSSMLCFARSPPIWSRCAPNAANLALENVAQKTINYLPNLAKKCIPHHTETGRKRNPKCALTSCHSGQSQTIFTSPIGPVNAVSTFPGELDLFTVASNFHVYTTRYFDPYFNYGGWFQIGDLSADPEAYVSAVSRSTDKWDIFVAGSDGQVWTAASGVGVWRPLPGIQVGNTTPVAAASPVTDLLAIFVVDVNGKLQASSWAPYLGGWTSWRQIGGVQLNPGAPVTAISRGYDQLELFVTDVNGNIQTTTVYPSFSGWKSIGVAASGSTVTGVSRHPGQLDLFVVLNQQVWTQGSPSLSSGFNSNSWRPISGLTPAEWRGSAVTAVSRNLDKLDVFVIGLDHNLWTAAWEPDFVQPGVSDWHVFQVQLPYGLPAFP